MALSLDNAVGNLGSLSEFCLLSDQGNSNSKPAITSDF